MSHSRFRRRLAAAAVAGSTALGLTMAAAGAVQADPSSAGSGSSTSPLQKALGQKPTISRSKELAAGKLKASLPDTGRQAFLVKLGTPSTGARFQTVRHSGTTAQAKAAAKSQLGRVASAQSTFIGHLGSLKGRTQVLYRAHATLDAVAVVTDVHNVSALYDLPGVVSVYRIVPKKPDLGYAVPFQGGDVAWEGDGDGKNLGQGVLVADIDTGLDYTHADFGGPGTPAAYDDAYAHDTEAPAAGSFDPKKFIAADSYDFAGDDYNADNGTAPQPDPNPLDCSPAHGGEGHGTHTAGIVAGYGVKGDGSTYDGAYGTSTDFASMQVGPGMAPKSTLVSYRVFGCTGTTNLVGAAIDRSMDPNGDGDTSDHVDAVNISIGGDWGTPDDGDAATVAAATDLGETIGISMGNSGDVYDVGGTPGAAPKAITVAASQDAQEVDDAINLHIAGGSDASLDGDVTASGSRSVMYAWGQPGEQYGGGDMPSSAELVDAGSIDPDYASGCSPIPAGTLDGKIAVFTQWHDAAPECGSIARGATARVAGAVGFLFISDANALSAGINGDQGPDGKPDDGSSSTDAIPGALVLRGATSGTPTDGALIKAALAAGATVTVSSTAAAASQHTDTTNNDRIADFSSRGIRSAGDLKPDVAAVGGTVFSALTGSGSKGQNMSGTSMAAPMVTGLAAVLKAEHRDWTPMQIKADIVNTAGHDVASTGDSPETESPMRVGSGRIDAAAATQNPVLATVPADAGQASASWGPVEFTAADGTITKTKTIKLQNTSLTSETYSASTVDAASVPGVSYSVSPGSVTVGPRGTATLTLTLTIDPTQWEKTSDPAKPENDPLTGLPSEAIAEAAGHVELTPSDTSLPALRVAFYSAPRLASTMTQASSVDLDGSGAGQLSLTGTPVATQAVQSTAEGFELTATSGAAPDCSDAVRTFCVSRASDRPSDIKYVGIGHGVAGYNDNGWAWSGRGTDTLDFAIVSQAPHATDGDQDQFAIYEDVDGDGAADYITINRHYVSGNTIADVTFAETIDANTGEMVDAEPVNSYHGELDTSQNDSDVLVEPVSMEVFGDATKIHYGIEALSPEWNDVDQVGLDVGNNWEPTLVADLAQPGLSVTQGGESTNLLDMSSDDASQDTDLSITQDAASYAEEGGQGLLMVHFHNLNGDKAQVVDLAAPTVTLSAVPSSLALGSTTTLTATVANATTGTVTFESADGTPLGDPVDLGGDGTASLDWTPSAAGSTDVKAVFDDGSGGTVESDTTTVTVAPAPTLGLTASATKVMRGVQVVFTATVKNPTSGGVTFTDGTGATLGTAKVRADGTAILRYVPKVPGQLKVVAAYATGTPQEVTSKPVWVKVTKAPAKITLNWPSTVRHGKQFTVTVKVATLHQIAPTGSVSLTYSGKTEKADLSAGVATFSVTAPSKAGTLRIKASYPGDATYWAGSKVAWVPIR